LGYLTKACFDRFSRFASVYVGFEKTLFFSYGSEEFSFGQQLIGVIVGWPLTILQRTSVRYSSGSTSVNLQVSISGGDDGPVVGTA
jgi:hypothetical protein